MLPYSLFLYFTHPYYFIILKHVGGEGVNIFK